MKNLCLLMWSLVPLVLAFQVGWQLGSQS